MRLEDLKHFITVVKTRSLSRASERLGIAQPSLSSSIKKLETSLGVTLFHRSRMGMQLTIAGRHFYSKSESLIALWDATERSALQSCEYIAGEIVFGCHSAVAQNHISLQVAELIKQNTRLSLRMVNGLSREIHEMIISFVVDIGIIVNPIAHPDLVIIPLSGDVVGFWQHDDYTAPKEGITLLCDPSLKQTQQLKGQLQKNGVSIQREIHTSCFEMLYTFVKEKVGLAILPESKVKNEKNAAIKRCYPTLYYEDNICLVYRHENRNIKAIQAISNAIR